MKDQNNIETEAIEIDIVRLLKVLWKKKWLILLVSVITALAGYAFARFLITPRYDANVLMYVNNSSNTNSSAPKSASDISAAQSLVDTYIVILESRNTMNDIIQRAGVNYTYEELRDMVSASSVNGTEIFRIKVNSPIPQEAAIIANTIADVLPGAIANAVEGSSVRVVDRAIIPTQKASPSNIKYAVVGLAIGLIVSCVIVLLRDVLDDAVHDDEYLKQAYDLPILAMIPDLLVKESDEDAYSRYKHSGKYEKRG